MTKQEIKDYYDIKTNKQYFWITKYCKKNNIIESDIIKSKEFIGLWDNKNNQPLSKTKTLTNFLCKNCGKNVKITYKVWIKLKHKDLCGTCAKSENLTFLNKTIIRDNNEKIWDETTQRGKLLRKKAKERRFYYNKNIQNNIIKSFSKEKKLEIKNKKNITWISRPMEERDKINLTRNPKLYMSEDQIKDFNKRISECGKKNAEIHRQYKIKWWNNLNQEREKHIFALWKKSKIKKHDKIFNIYYQGNYEKKFLDICCLNSLEVKRGPNIEYYDPIKNKIRIYMCDFLINNYLVEVKSEWWWKYHYKINKLKQIAAQNYATENGYKAYVLYILKDIEEDIDLERIKS